MEYKERLIQQLKEAMDVAEESGEDSYICDGLSLAIEIVKSGLDSYAREVAKREISNWG